jgi:hypothetical protein
LERLSVNLVDNRFDGIHRGQRGFVIGGGPSILDLMDNGFSFEKLSDDITVGANKIYIYLIPTYLLWTDPYFWNTFHHELDELDCIKFCPDFVVLKTKKKEIDAYIFRGDDIKGDKTYALSMTDIIPAWRNTGVTALRIAVILGLNPIYLLGMDCRKEDDKGRTHCHNEYDKDRISKTKPETFDFFAEDFIETVADLTKIDIKVYSCSPTSQLNDSIEYKDIMEIV